MRTSVIRGSLRVAALIVPLLGTVACDSKTARALKPGEFLSSRHDFSITFPRGWEQKRFKRVEVAALSPREGSRDRFRENVNVNVDRLPRRISVDEYVQASMANVAKMLTGFRLHRSGDATVDGRPAHWKVFSHRMGKIEVKCLAYFFVEGRKGYVVTCSAMPESYSRYEREFRSVAESLRFE